MADSRARLSLAAFAALAGRELVATDWLLIDQAAIDRFAETTGDHQFIHVDPERAAATPLGGTIAHAFHLLSLLGGWCVNALPSVEGAAFGLNYGLERVRFTHPVRSGRRVRGRFTLKSVEERRPGQWLATLGVVVEIEGEAKPAVVADWLILLVAGG